MTLDEFIYLFAVLSLHLAFVVSFAVIGELSRILGQAMKRRRLYFALHGAGVLVVAAQVLFFLGDGAHRAAVLLDGIALCIAAAVSLYYWGWLPADLRRKG